MMYLAKVKKVKFFTENSAFCVNVCATAQPPVN